MRPIGNTACGVLGVRAPRGKGSFGNDQDDVVIMPLKTVQPCFTDNQDIRSIMVAVDTPYETSNVQASLTALLREQRHLTSSQPDNFNILDTRQIADAVSGTTQIMTALLGAVAAVSLVVGGIR